MDVLGGISLLLIGGIVFFIFIIFFAFATFYKKIPQGKAIVRTGVGGGKVAFNKGMYVIPILHQMEIMDISVKKLQIDRLEQDGLICKDNIRADIKVAFFVRVNKNVDDVLNVAQSIGTERASDPETLYHLFEAKFSEALKTVGKKFDFIELYEARREFRTEILNIIGTDLNGYHLDDCAIDFLEQTEMKFLSPQNILDSQGIKKITELTAAQNIKANLIKREEEKVIKKQDVEAREAILELERQMAEKVEKQRREIDNIQAREQAEILKVREEERLKSETVRIKTAESLAVQEENKLRQIIIAENNTIPIIQTDEKGIITDYINLDSTKVAQDPQYVLKKLKEFQSENDPITWTNPLDSTKSNIYYYGDTRLLNQVRYYPVVQLLIVSLFIIITITALTTSFKSSQNQIWAGMAKETAHQLGTPLTSLQGWIEMLKEYPENEKIVHEMEKDTNRLILVSDRFGKIGSTPQLESRNIVQQVHTMVDYMKKRASGKVSFSIDSRGKTDIPARISPPLFDWVIENLLKNALDAMEGKGSIHVLMQENPTNIIIDVTDTGKGIAAQNISRVFKPGFTTKKRGWGLGLSLSKRIIEQYHQGKLFVKHSEVGKGTTFRIVLNK